MSGIETIGVAAFGGLVPSLVWLAFWLLEDRCQPEPKLRILLTFIAGAAAVGLVLPLEYWAMSYVSGVTLLLLWAFLEESLKLLAAVVFGLSSKSYDEPVDAVIYLVTAALGFSAAENALFLFTGPLQHGTLSSGLLLGSERFIGASLLHILSSATIGLFIAFAYYKNHVTRFDFLAIGLILATLLHAVFNFLILQAGAWAFSVFVSLWGAIIVVLFLVERIKDPVRDYC
ncbi:MAG: PrsW family intramembrane metalloprotease [Patescibacteria group bacterium]|nr:PrsW family intramembrane metalloprotease [Patescibacteria group bacterium]